MTDDELLQQKRRLDEQLEVAISWLREAHRTQVRALEAVWAASRQEGDGHAAAQAPVEAPVALPERPRRGSLEVYDEVVAILEKLPVNFNKNDVCRLLGAPPDRVALFRALQRLGDEKRIEVVEQGSGRRTTVYRRIDGSGAVSSGG